MRLTAPQHDYDGYPDLLEDYFELGWTDGLPMMPRQHLVGVPCPQCKLSLLRSPETVSPTIVFCDLCLAGGPYDAVIEGNSPVDSNYVTRDKAKGMLLENFGFDDLAMWRALRRRMMDRA